MSYVMRTLSKDEEIREDLRLHWINYIFPGICFTFGCLVLLFGFETEGSFILGIIVCAFSIWRFVELSFIEMVVTNKRVVFKKGIIATHTEELKNAKIESVEIRQGIFDRIFGCGSLCFSGTGTSKVKFESVDNPWKVKSRIEEYIGD